MRPQVVPKRPFGELSSLPATGWDLRGGWGWGGSRLPVWKGPVSHLTPASPGLPCIDCLFLGPPSLPQSRAQCFCGFAKNESVEQGPQGVGVVMVVAGLWGVDWSRELLGGGQVRTHYF